MKPTFARAAVFFNCQDTVEFINVDMLWQHTLPHRIHAVSNQLIPKQTHDTCSVEVVEGALEPY
jgi:hypothetical protein